MSELKIRKMELNYSSSSKVEMAACAFTWHVNANNTKMMCTYYLISLLSGFYPDSSDKVYVKEH